jgi:hypothetical protein
MPVPQKKETWVAGKKEGHGRQSVVPVATGRLFRTGRYGSRFVAGQEARPSSQSKLE